MFFLSKLVWILGQPLSHVFLLVVLCVAAVAFGKKRSAAASAGLAGVILFVSCYTTLGSYLMQDLEERFARPADPPALGCMIVLGGAFENEVNTARHGIELNAGADRFVEALRLAQKYPASRIVVSGGDGSLSGSYDGDAVSAEQFFPTFGVPAARLVTDKTSRTTFENGENTRQLLSSNNLSGCLLITSGYHMPRSVGIFRKLGIDVVPWPTDYRTDGHVRLGFDLTQPTLNLQNLSTALREWYGLVGYYLAGRTSALYPA